MKTVKPIFAVGAGVLAMLLCGCATNGDITRLEREIGDVRMTADQALSQARSAKAAADDANARSQRTEEMLNRSFQKSMRK